jgi:hypothetical protein
MHETADDLAELQRQLDESAAAGGPHLKKIFSDDRQPSAGELVALLDGIREVHLACVTADGAPLVAPIDALVFRGRLWLGLPASSVRARLIKRDPRVSVSYNDPRIALVVHGTLVLRRPDQDPEFIGHLREQYRAAYGDWWDEWYEGLDHTDDVGGYVQARRIFARRGDEPSSV